VARRSTACARAAAAVSSMCKGNDALRLGGIANVAVWGPGVRGVVAAGDECPHERGQPEHASEQPDRRHPAVHSGVDSSADARPGGNSLPILHLPQRVTAPAGAWPSHAVHQLDRQFDGCALPEKVEENLHPSAPGAGPLHDRDQPRERAALDLHPIPRPERRERSDDTPFARTGGDEPDHAPGWGWASRRRRRSCARRASRPLGSSARGARCARRGSLERGALPRHTPTRGCGAGRPRPRAARAAAPRSLPSAPWCGPRTTDGPDREQPRAVQGQAYGAGSESNFSATKTPQLQPRFLIFRRFCPATRIRNPTSLSHPCIRRAGALPNRRLRSRGLRAGVGPRDLAEKRGADQPRRARDDREAGPAPAADERRSSISLAWAGSAGASERGVSRGTLSCRSPALLALRPCRAAGTPRA